MAVVSAINDSLVLSEQLLSDLEMGRSLTSVALRASRLARLMGDVDVNEIMMFEVNGYPQKNNKPTEESWRLANIAGRLYTEEVDGKLQQFGQFETLEQLEMEIEGLKKRLPRLSGTNLANASTSLRKKVSLLGNRRSYIHGYVSGIYFELKFSTLASNMFERIQHKVDKSVAELIPQAVKKLTSVYDNLLSQNTEDWSNAVHSCRRILQDVADVLYPPRASKIINPGPRQREIKLGADNYINRLVAYVEENSASERFEEIVGSHMKYLGERLDSIFQAAQKGSHDVITSQDEADRYVIYTYLVIGDILKLKADVDSKASPATE
ncbi:hypothetical protein [Pseudomonas syringae]|uniref:AbiTii domain-containing protein n=1 Tax=Pseudomonas syringae TaxID=317 RepID=UPI001604F73A|nr:hypothetical protein [Pseudomonas syringae]